MIAGDRQDELRLRQHVRDCQRLYEDFRWLLYDWGLKRNRIRVQYAVDFSEIFSYALPQSQARDLAIFTGDEPEVMLAVQQYVLWKLFFDQDAPIVILPPYAVELRSFAEHLRTDQAKIAVELLPKAQGDVAKVVGNPAFASIERLAQRLAATPPDPTVDAKEVEAALEFFRANAATLLTLAERSGGDPLQRLARVLHPERITPLGAILQNDLQLDEQSLDAWQTRLEYVRGDRRASNRLDAMAAVMVSTANRLMRESGVPTQLRLVTRSPHMHRVERELAIEHGLNRPEDHFLRHPRAFVALRRAEGGSPSAVIDRLKLMQTPLEAVIDAYASWINRSDRNPETDAEMRRTIGGLIHESQNLLFEGINLASLAAVSRTDPTEISPGGDPRSRVLRLFDMTNRADVLLREVSHQVAALANTIDQNQQLLAVAVQSRSAAAEAQQLTFENQGPSTVVKSRLYWMPYTLHFRNKKLRRWSAQLAKQKDITLPELLKHFKDGFTRGLDHEMALSLAYLLGAWDQWDLALKYCDIALTQQRLDGRKLSSHEGDFFKAVCWRMLGARTANHYAEAMQLLDGAQAQRSTPDPRYAKEKATLLFYWARANRRAHRVGEPEGTEWREGMALRLCSEALEQSYGDTELRVQIFNNLCFHFCDVDPEHHQAEVRRYLEALEHELKPTPVEDWPINCVDTALFARCRLKEQRIDLHHTVTLYNVLRTAVLEQRVWAIDMADVRRHLAEAADVLPLGLRLDAR